MDGFIKVYKQYTEKAKWHYTSKPRHSVEFGGFNFSYSASDASAPMKTHNLWLNEADAQAAASEFPDVLMLNINTKQVLTVEEHQQYSIAEEDTSTQDVAQF